MKLSRLQLQRLMLVFISGISLATLLSHSDAQKRDPQLVQPQKQPPISSRRRTALVIGNAEYKSTSKLPNPTNDAEDVAGLLLELHFELVGGKAYVNQT